MLAERVLNGRSRYFRGLSSTQRCYHRIDSIERLHNCPRYSVSVWRLGSERSSWQQDKPSYRHLTNRFLNQSHSNRNRYHILQRNQSFSTSDNKDLGDETVMRRKSRKSTTKQDVNKVKSIEEQYSRKTPLEHVLLRPGMYIGPTERLPPTSVWVLDDISAGSLRMTKREYGLVPALIKIFDEILVNASDNRLRDQNNCTKIDVVLHKGSNTKDDPPRIRIWNNGKGVPVHLHKKEKLYVPELVFGHLMTGSNFDDSEKRLTGGRHGYGAKLANIFSNRFTVETLDSKEGLHYTKTWSKNMNEHDEAVITKIADQSDYTCIEFEPDLHRLGCTTDNIPDEEYDVMCRRVVDVAGCFPTLEVTLNGQDVSMGSFAEYCQLYRTSDAKILFKTVNKRWTVGVGCSESGSFETVSFVNGMATSRGGTHVNMLVNQITKSIQDMIVKGEKELGKMITPTLIRRHLFLACNAQIENPTFDSQMKESLTSSPDTFGSTCKLAQSFLSSLTTTIENGGPGIVEELLDVLKGQNRIKLLKAVGPKTKKQLMSIPKLEDAHLAGTVNGGDCTLILTEGDSAKALAVAGLEIIGRERFGVFPLRGKFLNVRDATTMQLTKNEEVKALTTIIGLNLKKKYNTESERQQLRYGRILLMTDQDNDGSHIKGLVMNFFRHFWPALLKPVSGDDHSEKQPFLASFVTPLLKASHKQSKKKTFAFYSTAEYNSWRLSMSETEMKEWSVKYYKGLGTSTPAEAKEYFSSFDKNLLPYRWKSDVGGDLLDMVFDKDRAADRRDWISKQYDEALSLVIDPKGGNEASYEDFVNLEMIHFSNASNIRSLPSLVDGLKPSQRKVLFACFKRNLFSEIKVAQLTGYCAEHTAYHHGEASLQATIIGMAQDFVGSNNINLLEPSGQFGTRFTGGNDAASPRYIFTRLHKIARKLFPKEDDVLLNYIDEDGDSVEPVFYCPVIPFLLVNGSQGIGTGWSTTIPPYNPSTILQYIRGKLAGSTDLPRLLPYGRGFTGKIEPNATETGFITYGRAKAISSNTILIDELPFGVWTNIYKQKLLNLCEKGEVTSFVENHTTSKVSFILKLPSSKLKEMEATKGGLEAALKLTSNLLMTNMHAFDDHGNIRKFESAEEIADVFFPLRMRLYDDRKSVLESEANYHSLLLRNKARFIECVRSGVVDLVKGRSSRHDLCEDLKKKGFSSVSDLRDVRNDNDVLRRRTLLDQKQNDDETDADSDFDYLLNMPFSSLTQEKITELNQDAKKKETELEAVRGTTSADLWRADLDELENHI